MKKTAIYFLMMTFVTSSILTSCKKDDDDDENNNTPATVNTADLFNYSDAYGVLVGVKSVTTQNVGGFETEIPVGTAVAIFPSALGASTFVDAGTVTANTKNLTKQSNNAYVFTPSQTDFQGITFGSSGTSWEVSGSTSVQPFDYTFSSFPNTPKITSSVTEVSLSDGYTFTLQSGGLAADTLLYILASGNKYVEKRVAGNVTSVTFSASDLATLTPSSQGLIQVTPYTINPQVINGKKHYFINQVTVSNFANFKN